MTFTARMIAKTSILALVLSMTTMTVVTVSATPAFAERGGNGNGNGGDRGNRGGGERGDRGDRGDRGERAGNRGNGNGNRGGNGRGELARELGGLNAAHANQRALENASPDSMPGKLYAYQQAQENFVDVVATQDAAYAEFQRLDGLTEDEIAAAYPDGGYEEDLAAAADAYRAAREDAVAAQENAQNSLAILTDGRELSSGALSELNRLLGL